MTREQAGDYVLGLLDGAERETFEAAMARDAQLNATVRTLAGRLHALDDTATGEAGAGLWARIDARISALPQLPPLAANTNSRRLPGWAALAASVVVALGLGYLAGRAPAPVERQATVVAVLLNEIDQTPAAIIEAFADDTISLVALERFAVPEGSVLEIWTLPDADTGPVSLGTLAAPMDARLTGPDLPDPAEGQLYEITLEPSPGSPTGRPTGPILAKGYAKTRV